ncbi:MAG: hypothetical protein ABSD08_15170 [Xanthobacteraceae bacterium]|jgi:hypothetical protein
MGLFGKLFSKRADPDAERFRQLIEQAVTESKKPQGAYKSALSGADKRHRLLELIERFEAETGQDGVFFADTVEAKGRMFVNPGLIALIRRQSDGELLEQSLFAAFPTPDAKRGVYEQWTSTIAKYQGQQNTEELLREKSAALAAFIICNLDIAGDVLDLAAEFYAETPTNCPKLSDEQKTSVRLEEAALWYRVVDELAQKFLGQEPSWLFMDHLLDNLANILALQGASPNDICGTMIDRINEYGQYRKWIAEEGKGGAAGTLFWEAGKHILEPFGCSENFILLKYFSILFLERLPMALVYELLTGRSDRT